MQTRTRTWLKTFVLATAIASLAACSYTKQFESGPNDYGSGTEPHERLSGTRTYGIPHGQTPDHNNQSLEFDQATSNAIDRMSGIRTSFVFKTDKNVYAAIVLDKTATGVKGKGKMNTSDRATSPRVDDHGDYSERVPPGTALLDKYTFDTIPNPRDLSSELRSEITALVRKRHPEVSHVFISANKDFINQFSQYAHQSWRGQPLQPSIGGFNQFVQGHFQDFNMINPGE